VNKSILDQQGSWIVKSCEAVGAENITTDTVQATRKVWFRNPLNHASLRLTLPGYNWFTRQSKFQSYKIELASAVSSQQMLQLESLFTAPYYIQQTGTVIHVFSDTDAVMLQLHAGNLKQYLDNLESNNG
jgi:hypothetical protein